MEVISLAVPVVVEAFVRNILDSFVNLIVAAVHADGRSVSWRFGSLQCVSRQRTNTSKFTLLHARYNLLQVHALFPMALLFIPIWYVLCTRDYFV